jgi:hypothetical protein
VVQLLRLHGDGAGLAYKMAFGGSNIKTERLTIRPSSASGGFCDYTIEVDRLVKNLQLWKARYVYAICLEKHAVLSPNLL